MRYEMANMVEKTQQLEEALVTMAAFMAEAKQQPPAPAPPTPPAPLSMEQQFAAFVAPQQQKEAPKEQSAIDKAVAKALGELSTKGSSGGGGTRGTKRKESLASAVFSTATPMVATSPTTATNAKKRRLGTLMQPPSVIQATEKCGTRIFTPGLAVFPAMSNERFGGQSIIVTK
jgi:hypothetical protein